MSGIVDKEKMVPELRFSGFDEVWTQTELSQLLSFKNGINASKDRYGFGYKFINVLDIIQNNFITHKNIPGLVNITDEEFQKYIVTFGDVLFQRSSETREEVGQANVYLDKEKPATFGGFVIRGKAINKYNPVFMNFLLKTSRSRKEITSKSGGSTRYNVGQDTLSKVKVFTTSLNEQQKIANFLTTIDQRITLLKQKTHTLEQYKKSLMQKIFSQEIRFKPNKNAPLSRGDTGVCFDELSEQEQIKNHDNLNEYPSAPTSRGGELGGHYLDWEEKLFYSLLDNVLDFRGRTPKKLGMDWGGGNIVSLSANNVKNGKIDLSLECNLGSNELYERWMGKVNLNVGCIVFTMEAPLGNAVIITEDKKYILSQRVVAFKFKESIKSEFMIQLIWSNDFQNTIDRYSTGSTAKGINQKSLKKIKVMVPCLEEQQKIADCLSAIDQSINHVSNQIYQTTQFKKGLLQRMFI